MGWGRMLGAAALMQLVVAAAAQEAVTPPGSPLAMVPPPGFSPSRHFAGFVDERIFAAIVISPLPAPGAGGMDPARAARLLERRGIRVLGHERAAAAGGIPGLLVRGEEERDGKPWERWFVFVDEGPAPALVSVSYPRLVPPLVEEGALRRALATLRPARPPQTVSSATVPPETVPPATIQRAARPRAHDIPRPAFTFSEGKRFRVTRTDEYGSVWLAEAPAAGRREEDAAWIGIARHRVEAPPAGPVTRDLDIEWRRLLEESGRVSGFRVIEKDGLVIDGRLAVEILGEGASRRTGRRLFVYQTLVSLSGGSLYLVATAPAERRQAYLAEFRRIARSLRPAGPSSEADRRR